MFVFIATVHHTGTQFTEKLFKDAGYGPTDKTNGLNGQNDYHRAHIDYPVQTELKDWLERGFPLVVPLRHPLAVAKSWKARRKPIEQLIRQYELLETLVDPYQPLYLPIDHPERDRYFTNLRLKVDLRLKTDWAVHASKAKGSDHQAQLEPVPLDKNDIKLLGPVMFGAFMGRFYPPKVYL